MMNDKGFKSKNSLNMASTKRLLIIEPQLSGHHFRYLDWIASAACSSNWQVIVATDERFIDDAALVSLKSRLASRLELKFYNFSGAKKGFGLLELIQREIYYCKKLRAIFRSVNAQGAIDQVLLPFADICLYALALHPKPFGKCPWSGITMRPAFHYYEMGLSDKKPGLLMRIKEKLFFRLSKSEAVGKLCVIDPCLAEYAAKRQPQSRLIYLQDPADINAPPMSRVEARRKLGLDLSRSVVLLYGAVDWRKGIRELIEAQASLPREQRPVVIVAGRLAQEIRQWVTGEKWREAIQQGSVTVLDRFITEEEEHLLFCACDAVWLGYRGHLGSSGVLWQALAFERPVIACEEGLIGWLTRNNNLGVTVRVSDPRAVAVALGSVPPTVKQTSELTPLAGRDFAARLMQAIA